MMRNASYFTLKTLFVLKIFKVLSSLFSQIEKTTWLEIYGITTLLTKKLQCTYCQIKFTQLIEYIMSNTFIEKSYTKCNGETIPRPFLVSLPHFMRYFRSKIFFLLYSINWPNFIVWLPLTREILGNMCIVIIC